MIRRLFLLGLFLILLLEIIGIYRLSLMPGLSYKNLALYLLVFLLGLRAALSPDRFRVRDPEVHAAFLMFIVYVFLTWAVSAAFDPTYPSWRAFIGIKGQWVDYYLMFLIFRYGLDTPDDALWLLKVISQILLLVCLLVFVDYVNIYNFEPFTKHHGRANGFVGEANQFGAFLVFFLPIALVLFRMLRPRPFWFWGLTIGLSVFLLVATGSRGAYVAAITGPFIAAWYLRHYVSLRTVFRVGGAAVVVVALIGLFAVAVLELEFITERIEKTASDDMTAASAGRLDIWAASFRVMAEWPWSYLVGYGWFSYEASGIWKSAHSEYIHAFYELGIVGVVLFVLIFYSLFSRTRSSLSALPTELGRLQMAFMFGLASLLIDVIFLAPGSVWPLIWCITGLVLKLQSYEAASVEEEPLAPVPEPNLDPGSALPLSGIQRRG